MCGIVNLPQPPSPPLTHLHLFTLPQRVVLLHLHQLHLHSALQHMHAGVAQILADKVLQVETFKGRHRGCQHGGLHERRDRSYVFLNLGNQR